MPTSLLAAVSALEIGGGSLAAAYTARLLASLGASVTVVERDAEGGAVRRTAPLTNGRTGRISLPHLWTSVGKQWLGVARGPAGDALLERMAAGTDLVLSGDRTEPLRGARGTLIITPFGMDGPWRGWQAAGPSLFHAAGLGSVTPRAPQTGTDESVPPLAPAGYIPEYFGGAHAAAAAIACLLSDDAPVLDVSLQHCLLPLMRRELAAWWYESYVASRNERLWRVAPSGFYECRDGAVYASVVEDAQWSALCGLMGRADLLDNERLASPERRFENPDLLEEALGPWFRAHDRMEVFEACGRAGVPVGAVLGPWDLSRTAHMVSRGALIDYDGVVFPGLPIRAVGNPTDEDIDTSGHLSLEGRPNAILRRLGLGENEIADALQRGAVW